MDPEVTVYANAFFFYNLALEFEKSVEHEIRKL